MKLTNRGFVPVILGVSWLAFAATDHVDPRLYLDDVKFLASEQLRGRATGSPELEKAAAFISGKFHEFGLKPVAGKSYFQAFPVTTDARLGKANHFQFTEGSRTTVLRPGDDFVPFKFSHDGKISGAVVFAGYGITAPEHHYDDYAGIDVKGKIVLILRHEPQEFDEHSVFDGKNFSDHATFPSKASNAKMHGAAAVILIADRGNHKYDIDELQKFGNADGPDEAGIPFVQVKEEKIDGWFAAAGRSLETIQAEIDKDLKPEPFAFPDTVRVEAIVDIERTIKTVHNVAGYLPGQSDEYVVIGAHYDHLGLGERYSMAPKLAGTVHPGADDNASGTAGVIELARWFSKQPKQKRGILFLTFAGEEMGLLGSQFYVGHPGLPLAKAVAMINMDMIGRVRDGKVYIGGSATGTDLRAMLDRITPKYSLKIDYSDSSGYGASDHTSFTAGRVPVLFFFSGLHTDYHKPSDTWEKIDAPGAAKLLDLVAEITGDLRESSARPQYVRVVPPPAAHGDGGVGPVSGSSGSSGYGPYFGSVPDFGEGITGVKFSDVREGSPAAKAGLKAGDVMVEWDSKPIQNLYDFTYALRGKKPGDEVKVKVMRDGKPLEVNVLLTKRD
jgi:hypothetical protein